MWRVMEQLGSRDEPIPKITDKEYWWLINTTETKHSKGGALKIQTLRESGQSWIHVEF